MSSVMASWPLFARQFPKQQQILERLSFKYQLCGYQFGHWLPNKLLIIKWYRLIYYWCHYKIPVWLMIIYSVTKYQIEHWVIKYQLLIWFLILINQLLITDSVRKYQLGYWLPIQLLNTSLVIDYQLPFQDHLLNITLLPLRALHLQRPEKSATSATIEKPAQDHVSA